MRLREGPIGIFDSGYGGMTVFREIINLLPHYDYIYLGDNARVPYGNRTFETVYSYTLECVNHLFNKGCNLVILACNTSSAKALRTIQQNDLNPGDTRRVLGVIRPTTENIGHYTKTNHVGIFATQGTVNSESYIIEIKKLFPQINVFQEACPMWVPLVEYNEHNKEGADYFVRQHIDALLSRSKQIDTVLLACTHYPLLYDKIRTFLPRQIQIITQGKIVAESLENYLSRHRDMDALCAKNNSVEFYTTESAEDFNKKAKIFWGEEVRSIHLEL